MCFPFSSLGSTPLVTTGATVQSNSTLGHSEEPTHTAASHPDARPNSPAPLNMNRYANKKSAAESMLDVALLMANAT
eukprot:superscaffoldBa00000119_g1715